MYYVKWNLVFIALGNFKILISPLEKLICIDERYLFSNYQFVFYHKKFRIGDSNFQSCLITKVLLCCAWSLPYSLSFGLKCRIAFKTLTLMVTCSGTKGLRFSIKKMGIIVVSPQRSLERLSDMIHASCTQ